MNTIYDLQVVTIALPVAMILLMLIIIIWICIRSIKESKRMRQLADNALEISTDEFFKVRKNKNWKRYDFTGVYILHNTSKDKYYVGQGKSVFTRVRNHFTGHGNGDVYADYKYGDKFTIRMIKFENSGCRTLNELERKMIQAYDAYSKGYNKTKGNAN